MAPANRLLALANANVCAGRPPEPASDGYGIDQGVTYTIDPRQRLDFTLIWFRMCGCRFDRRGECTMCDFGVADRVAADQIIYYPTKALEQPQHYEALFISPSASLFDLFEVPPTARRAILELVAATNCVIYSCESRPEFITDEVLDEFSTILKDKGRGVGMGLESADPWILRACLGKSLTPESFRDSVARLRAHDVRPLANILLGATFLSEWDAVTSTVNSVRWVLDQGTHRCPVFPSNLKRWTLQHWLWQCGLYSSASLWSLVEVIYKLAPEYTSRVSISTYSINASDRFVDFRRRLTRVCPRSLRDCTSIRARSRSRSSRNCGACRVLAAMRGRPACSRRRGSTRLTRSGSYIRW